MQRHFTTSSLNFILLLICASCTSKDISGNFQPTTSQIDYSSSHTPTATLANTPTPTSSLTPTHTIIPTSTPFPLTFTPTPISTPQAGRTYHCDEIIDISITDNENGWAVVNCWASVANRAPTTGFIYRLLNGKWQVDSDAPDLPGVYACYTAISALNPDEMWAIGLKGGVYVCETENWIVHYLNGKWEVVSIDNLFPSLPWYQIPSLYSIQMLDSENGWAGGKGIILRYKKDEWSIELELPIEKSYDYYAVTQISMSSINEGWAWAWKREGGVFLRYQNNIWKQWKDLVFEKGVIVSDIDAISADEAWAVGYRDIDYTPAMWHFVNGRWIEVEPPIKIGALQSIKMINENEGWATGGMWNRDATVLHYTDGQWKIVSTPTEASILSVDATDPNNVWIGAEKFYKFLPPKDWQPQDIVSVIEK